MFRSGFKIAAAVLALPLAAAGLAQTTHENRPNQNSAGQIATQPARDVGIQRTEVPPVLERAAADPYGLDGARTCAQISAAIIELSGVLGTDFDMPAEAQGSEAGRIAAAGGRMVVNSVVPFRSLIRELSGAADQQRRLEAAVDAGIARRGFLRGLHRSRGCRTGLAAPATAAR
ncbi:hypothetical protein RCO27_19070 [Sphingosinicella sp. LHD-64]|uniref:hypothetical protein n=1 Tax=Sphingosinicella sp. LHD-64 TaxID=3072139 RepID=UPI00280EC903|nr:hypothetical protein [Sphingosinicella sp. LHD-64]MDQ8758336.1 hypothetical protein [Sphingosinicella sp. LHD-64]